MPDSASREAVIYPSRNPDPPKLLTRLFSRNVGGMLIRNTVVSTFVFVLGLALLWMLVSLAGMNEVIAAGIGFVVANSLHYFLGRSWIFRGTARNVTTGYVYFLMNSGVGLIVTMLLYAAFLSYTDINYLVARIIVSVFAGLIVFVLNAVLNFRQV